MKSDSELITLFFERSEDAIKELSEKYGRLCRRIAVQILGNEEDAEECVNDTYFALWSQIPPNRPNPLMAYVCRIARNIAIDRLKYRKSEKRSGYTVCLEELEECLTCELEETVTDPELTKALQDFLEALRETDRTIFLRRFWFFDSYEEIAARTGMREGAVRTRISRIKAKLKEYLVEKGVTK